MTPPRSSSGDLFVDARAVLTWSREGMAKMMAITEARGSARIALVDDDCREDGCETLKQLEGLSSFIGIFITTVFTGA